MHPKRGNGRPGPGAMPTSRLKRPAGASRPPVPLNPALKAMQAKMARPTPAPPGKPGFRPNPALSAMQAKMRAGLPTPFQPNPALRAVQAKMAQPKSSPPAPTVAFAPLPSRPVPVLQRQTFIHKDLGREYFHNFEEDADFRQLHAAVMDEHHYDDSDFENRDEELERVMHDEALARRARLERHRHRNALNDLDRIASFILAIAWSGRQANDAVTQGRISLQTVAVSDLDGQLTVACNGFSWVGAEALVRQALADEGENRHVNFLAAPDGAARANFHAEMQLVDHFGARLRGHTLGVSKPCCQKCRAVLDAEGVDYATWTNFDPGDRWQAPARAYRWNMDQMHDEFRRNHPWFFDDDDDD